MPALRSLGRSGLQVHPLCLGGGVSRATLDAYADGGGNFVDADGAGEAETAIGEWLHGRADRDSMIVATTVSAGGGIAGAVDASLRRLQRDRIDLLYLDEDEPSTPLDETLPALDALVRAGKVRALGAARLDTARLAEALDVAADAGLAALEVVRPDYGPLDRDAFEGELEQLCREEELAVVPRVPARDWQAVAPVRTVADRLGATPAQAALAWVMARPSVTAPLASAITPEEARELLGAPAVALTPSDIAELDRAGATS